MIATIRRHPLAATVIAGLAGVLAWAALAPVHFPSREEVFEIPKGTFARRMSGDPVEILPSAIYLTLGVRDVLLLRNLDEVPQVFGPTLMMPGQSFSLPFGVASEYQFACTAHSSGQMTVVVHPRPDSPWLRLRWRAHRLWESFGSLRAGASAGPAEGAIDAKYAKVKEKVAKESRAGFMDPATSSCFLCVLACSSSRPLRPLLLKARTSHEALA